MKKFDREFKSKYMIYLEDECFYTGDIKQRLVIAHTETENSAKLLTDFLNNGDDEPMRTYLYEEIR